MLVRKRKFEFIEALGEQELINKIAVKAITSYKDHLNYLHSVTTRGMLIKKGVAINRLIIHESEYDKWTSEEIFDLALADFKTKKKIF